MPPSSYRAVFRCTLLLQLSVSQTYFFSFRYASYHHVTLMQESQPRLQSRQSNNNHNNLDSGNIFRLKVIVRNLWLQVGRGVGEGGERPKIEVVALGGEGRHSPGTRCMWPRFPTGREGAPPKAAPVSF